MKIDWYRAIRPIIFLIDPETLHEIVMKLAEWLDTPPNKQGRCCHECGDKIDGCMGFVNAEDFLSEKSTVREICGKCAIKKLD